jgi:predicted glycoside hydrolase/deacetylase ChbG (UPF0249 family)
MLRRLIINADDLGYDPAVDAGLLRAMRQGLVSSATLMVNSPYSAEAARAARGLSVGLHLNLARWRPLTVGFSPSHLGADGAFAEAKAASLPEAVVEGEARAQLEHAAQLLGKRPTHLDVHKHLHRHQAILRAVAVVARAEGLPVRALDEEMRAFLRAQGVATPGHFVGEAGALAYWTQERFLTELAALKEGTTEWMCHPGEPPTQLVSGYSSQRRVELDTFTSEEAREALELSGVVLTDFAALASA